MAKRIQFSAHGGPEVLEYVDYTPAEPAHSRFECVTRPLA
jgi:NADPH2:quinone reductase